MQTKEYKNKFAISQSAIKDWAVMAPSKWYKVWVTKELPRPEAGAAASFGTLLDCLTLTPKLFDKNFLVADIQLPSDSIQKIVTDVLKHIKELNANAERINKLKKPEQPEVPMKELKLDYPDFITAFAKKHEYYVSQPQRAINEVMNKGVAFFDFLVKTEGKLVVSQEDKKTADELKEILYTNKRTRGFFVPKKGCRVVFQTRIFADLELSGFQNLDFMPMKGAIDIIHFNDTKKTVREVDLKWTNDAFLFKEAIKRFDYASQHSVYDFLLREWLKTYEGGKYADYDVHPPLNVVIDSDNKIPYIYSYNMNDLHIKRYGHEAMTWFNGWEQTINEIAWHMDTQQWEVPKEHYLNGFMNVKVFHK
jgi:hypothetical protein